jgi:hypothetical protein
MNKQENNQDLPQIGEYPAPENTGKTLLNSITNSISKKCKGKRSSRSRRISNNRRNKRNVDKLNATRTLRPLQSKRPRESMTPADRKESLRKAWFDDMSEDSIKEQEAIRSTSVKFLSFASKSGSMGDEEEHNKSSEHKRYKTLSTLSGSRKETKPKLKRKSSSLVLLRKMSNYLTSFARSSSIDGGEKTSHQYDGEMSVTDSNDDMSASPTTKTKTKTRPQIPKKDFFSPVRTLAHFSKSSKILPVGDETVHNYFKPMPRQSLQPNKMIKSSTIRHFQKIRKEGWGGDLIHIDDLLTKQEQKIQSEQDERDSRTAKRWKKAKVFATMMARFSFGIKQPEKNEENDSMSDNKNYSTVSRIYNSSSDEDNINSE